MDNGRMIQVSTPAGIYENPASVYVADFIGDVNLIEGSATPGPDGAVDIAYAEGVAPIKGKATFDVAKGQKVWFAIRPEKIVVGTEPDSTRINQVQGKIEDIGYLGNVSTYHVRLNTGALISAQMTNSRRLARRDFTWEDDVWLSFTDTAGIVLAN
jgi:putrescine transport system ATP-binding protein